MSKETRSGDGSFDEIRARVVERLRRCHSEIEQALYARIQKDVPDPIGDKNPEYQASLRATVTAILDYTFEVIERGLVSAPIPPAAAAQARRAARAGVSLGTIQRRYFAGHGELGDFVARAVEELGLSNDGRTLDHLRRAQETVLGHITASIEQEYMHERELIARPLERRRLETVQKLLAGEPVDQAEFDELDYQLHAYWHLGVIATGGEAKDVLSHLRTGLECKLLQVPCSDGAITGWLGGQHELAICDLERLLSANGYVDSCLVIGGPGRGLDGFRQTHREARDALAVALRKTEKIVRYADSPLFAAAVQNDTLMRWLKDFLAPLRSYKDGGVGLLQTLRALIDAECNRRAAATALDIDRHTVESRLRTAEELLGRTLLTCLPELDIALRLEELDGAMNVSGTPRAS
jgi:PucR C-terminal helix-turn-helix domain